MIAQGLLATAYAGWGMYALVRQWGLRCPRADDCYQPRDKVAAGGGHAASFGESFSGASPQLLNIAKAGHYVQKVAGCVAGIALIALGILHLWNGTVSTITWVGIGIAIGNELLQLVGKIVQHYGMNGTFGWSMPEPHED